ncbi:MAG: YicC family protein [Pirellulaceae bacterium]|nr:YicC family protein [Pirellulaceae bacterium]
MLLSMTGYGAATFQDEKLFVHVEIKTINNRYFKLSLRIPDTYSAMESRIEPLLKKSIRRGTVQVNIRVQSKIDNSSVEINQQVLAGYLKQLRDFSSQQDMVSSAISLEPLLSLPGVFNEGLDTEQICKENWPPIEKTLEKAVENLLEMRSKEGKAMQLDLQANSHTLRKLAQEVETYAPAVVEHYQNRIIEKLNKLLEGNDIELLPQDIIREVGIYADRCDTSEETVRLYSHLDQLESVVDAPESNGRKLDFLTQELFRETNTIGSKANHAEIAKCVVEMKTIIERIREMVQNIE